MPAKQPNQKRQPAGLAGSLVLLHEQAEEDHAGVGAEDGEQRGDVADAGDHADEHDHDARAEEVLDPAPVVAVLQQVRLVPVEHARRGDDEQRRGRDGDEGEHAPAERHVEERGELGRRCREARSCRSP